MMTEEQARVCKMVQRNYGGSPWPEYSDEYYTPSHIVRALGSFDIDPSAGPMEHAAINIRRPADGLAEPWYGRVWLNPPYRNLLGWVDKFIAHGDGVALVNARPDTRWFQRLAAGSSAVLWLTGRVKFLRPDGKPSRAPVVGSVLVAYGSHNAAALLASELPGVVMTVRHFIPNK